MPNYVFRVFANSEVGFSSSQLVQGVTTTATGTGGTMTVVDDDPNFQDENNSGGQTLDTLQQVLGAAIGSGTVGQVVQSVYSSPITNLTTGQSGTAYSIRIYTSTNPASPGGQNGQYYQAFTIAVHQGDQLSYGAGNFVGDVPYANLVGGNVGGAFSVADVSVNEGDTLSQTGQFVITRANGSGTASVSYAIADGGSANAPSATAGSDYSATTSGTINFADGQTSAVVQFTVIGDTIREGNEQFHLTLSSPTNGGTLARGIGYATIVDNDSIAGAQYGTDGNDTLIAQMANSTLVGLNGDDTYLVHGLGDVVIEANGGGTDIVYTDVSYNLGNNEVEALSVAQQTGTANINLIGNFVSQTIVGNYGDNVLNGGSGADTLIGLYGNDTYAVGDSRIVIQEQAGQGFDTVVTSVNYALGAGVSIEQLVAQDRSSTVGLSLTGNGFAQTIGGTSGADTINGGLGADTLIGFGGADTFAFTTALGNGNVDTLADFAAGTDKIGLSSGIFGAIGTSLDANEFVTGTAAATADQHIIYNATTGQIFYDADGSGAGAAVLFAVVAPGTALAVTDFTVVAPATPAT